MLFQQSRGKAGDAWVAGLKSVSIGGEPHSLLWVLDESSGKYVALHVERELPPGEIASCLFARLAEATSPDRIRFYGGPPGMGAVADDARGLGISFPAVSADDGSMSHQHRSLASKLRLELLDKEEFTSLAQAKLRIEEYRLQANLRRVARFAEMSERLGIGIVQQAYADETPDVLIVHLLNWFDAGRLSDEIFAPVGSSYIAAALDQAGYRVRLELFRHDGGPDSMPDSLRRSAPRVIGISATGHEIHELKCLSRSFKSVLPDVPIMVGGYCSLDGARLFEDSAIDVVVRGEGEATVCELVSRLLADDSVDDIPGILFRDQAGNGGRGARRSLVDAVGALIDSRIACLPGLAEEARILADVGPMMDLYRQRAEDFRRRTLLVTFDYLAAGSPTIQ